MPVKPSAEFLHRFPFFRATDVEHFGSTLQTLYGARLVDIQPAGGFEAWASYLHLDDIALGFAGCSVPATLDFSESEFVRQQIALRGRAITTLSGVDISVDDRQACTTSNGQPMRIRWGARHERLTLRIRISALERKLGALLGSKPKASVMFDAALALSDGRAQRLLRLVAQFAGLFDSEKTEPPPLVLRELEQALIVGFLLANGHPYSASLAAQSPKSAPHHVRLAEEFIEANWRQPILIDDLVEITGVSARSLFRSFKLYRGQTPMEFAKTIRMQHARRMLSSAGPNVSVTAVCYACGFWQRRTFCTGLRQSLWRASVRDDQARKGAEAVGRTGRSMRPGRSTAFHAALRRGQQSG
jgi:AraC-like DNA-binding protein